MEKMTVNILRRLDQSIVQNTKRNAFCINDTYYPYGVLSQHINKITNKLIDLDKGRVAIFCENNIETYAAILSCWTLGLAYVPILKKNPLKRNLDILVDARISCILCSDTQGLDDNYVTQFNLIDVSSFNQHSVSKVQPSFISGEMEAYLLFTSGSTGKPKGVPISFANLQYFLDSFKDSGFEINQDDRCLQMFELTFDVSISSFLTALLAGACVYTVSDKAHKYIDVLRIINSYHLTKIQIVPSILKLGQPLFKRIDFSSIECCILTGEATSILELQQFINVAPDVSIYNYYGPTECTIYCSFLRINNDSIKTYNGLVSIGKPFKHARFILMDSNGYEVEKGSKGELWISSNQLTSGYVDSGLNQVAFKILKDQIFYKTGDICWEDEIGDFYYCGRIDNQVQIQGFRVELGEIEFKSREILGLNCVSFDIINQNNFTELVLVLESCEIIVQEDVKQKLLHVLPHFMLPVQIFSLTNFPLTQSGKTDRMKIRSILNL